jgi:hypothetical protein
MGPAPETGGSVRGAQGCVDVLGDRIDLRDVDDAGHGFAAGCDLNETTSRLLRSTLANE